MTSLGWSLHPHPCHKARSTFRLFFAWALLVSSLVPAVDFADNNLQIDFLAWHQTCLTPAGLLKDQGSWLDLTNSRSLPGGCGISLLASQEPLAYAELWQVVQVICPGEAPSNPAGNLWPFEIHVNSAAEKQEDSIPDRFSDAVKP